MVTSLMKGDMDSGDTETDAESDGGTAALLTATAGGIAAAAAAAAAEDGGFRLFRTGI
jgi:hypothetical protein